MEREYRAEFGGDAVSLNSSNSHAYSLMCYTGSDNIVHLRLRMGERREETSDKQRF
jgi:hypothetical protein